MHNHSTSATDKRKNPLQDMLRLSGLPSHRVVELLRRVTLLRESDVLVSTQQKVPHRSASHRHKGHATNHDTSYGSSTQFVLIVAVGGTGYWRGSGRCSGI